MPVSPEFPSVIELQPAFVCEVSVVDAAGRPVPGATLHTWGSDPAVSLGVANSAGRLTVPAGFSTWARASFEGAFSDPVELAAGVDRRLVLGWQNSCRVRVVSDADLEGPVSFSARRLDLPGSPDRTCEHPDADGRVFDLTPGAYELCVEDPGWVFEGRDQGASPTEGKRLGPEFRHFVVTETQLGSELVFAIRPTVALRIRFERGGAPYERPVEIVTEFEVGQFGRGWSSGRVFEGSFIDGAHVFHGLKEPNLGNAGRIWIRAQDCLSREYEPAAILRQLEADVPITFEAPLERRLVVSGLETVGDLCLYEAGRGCSTRYEMRSIPAVGAGDGAVEFLWRGGDVFLFPGGIESVTQRPSPMARIPDGGVRLAAARLDGESTAHVELPPAGVVRVLDVPPEIRIECCSTDSGYECSPPRREGAHLVFDGLPPGRYTIHPRGVGGRVRRGVGAAAALDLRLAAGSINTVSWPKTWKPQRDTRLLVRATGVEPGDVWVAPVHGHPDRPVTVGQLGPWRRCNSQGYCSLGGVAVQPSRLVMAWRSPSGAMIPLGAAAYAPIVACEASVLTVNVRAGDSQEVALNLDSSIPGLETATSMLTVRDADETSLRVAASGVSVDFVGLRGGRVDVGPTTPGARVRVVGDYVEGRVTVRQD